MKHVPWPSPGSGIAVGGCQWRWRRPTGCYCEAAHWIVRCLAARAGPGGWITTAAQIEFQGWRSEEGVIDNLGRPTSLFQPPSVPWHLPGWLLALAALPVAGAAPEFEVYPVADRPAQAASSLYPCTYSCSAGVSCPSQCAQFWFLVSILALTSASVSNFLKVTSAAGSHLQFYTRHTPGEWPIACLSALLPVR